MKNLLITAVLALVLATSVACSSKTVVEEVYTPEPVEVERG